MAGATLSSPIVSASLLGSYKPHPEMCVQREQALFNASHSNGSGAEIKNTLSCIHCDFTCESSNAMTQHRWEVHPLLMRRKQHLMSSSIVRRKRQKSETLAGSSENLKNPSTLRRKMSSEQDAEDRLENTIRKKPKASSLDDLSFIEVQGHSRSHSVGSTSLNMARDGKNTGSLLETLCKNKSEHRENCRQTLINYSHPAIPRDKTSTSHELPRYNDGLDALASAALKMESEKLAQFQKTERGSFANGRHACFNTAFNSNENPMLISSDNMRHGFPTPDLVYNDQIMSLSHTPFIMSCLPTEASKLAASLDPRFLMRASLQAGSVPFPLNSLPAALYNNRYGSLPVPGQHFIGQNLSTLSDVASQLLSNDITRKFESQNQAKTLQDFSQSAKKFTPIVSKTESDSNHAISKPINIVPTSATPTKRGKKENSPVSSKSQGAQLRHLVDSISLKDDRMKPLEDALRKADCCDFNERSSVMPFRLEDGSWKMVRTKRIGGAWLVQMPGKEAPSVYFPNGKQLNGANDQTTSTSSINALLYNSKNSKPASPTSHKRIIDETREGEAKRTRTDTMTSPSKASYVTPSSSHDVIRNLLLQKTALVLP